MTARAGEDLCYRLENFSSSLTFGLSIAPYNISLIGDDVLVASKDLFHFSKENTMNASDKNSSSIFVSRKRVALLLFLAMLLMTLGAEVSTAFLGKAGVLPLLWPMAMLLLAIYWLRLFLADWMRRVQLGKSGDEFADEGCSRSGMLVSPRLPTRSFRP